jgi:hypothetical protein
VRFIRLHILFIIIAFSFKGFSSDSIFESNESSTVTIGFNTLATDGNSVNNYFIKEIARNNLSGLYKTAFTYNYSYNSSIEKSGDGVFKVIITLKGEKCTGDVYYKGFDLSDILMPDMADLRVVVSANGGFFISSGFEGLKFNEQNIAEFDFTFDYPEGDNAYSIRFENVHFYSRDDDKKEFNHRINLIDNYIASITFLKQAVNRFDSIDVQNTDNVLDTYIELNELSRIFERMDECEFVDELHIRNNDPKRYFDMLAKLERKLTSYRSVYNQLLNSLHGIQLHENLTDCASKYVDLIGHEFEMSQEVTHSYSTLFYQMGRIEYENSKVTDFLLGMDDIYSKADMDFSELPSESFTSLVLQEYTEKSENYILDQKYYLAKGLILNAKSLEKTGVSDYETSALLDLMASKADYGIYNSYLHITDRAIEIGNYDLAEQYLDKARSFQVDNSSSIISDASVNKMMEKLVTLFIVKGEKLNEEEEFDKALYCYTKAGEISNSIDRYNFNYEINKGKREAVNGLYRSRMMEANEMLKTGTEASAEMYLAMANSLLEDNPDLMYRTPDILEIEKEINWHFYEKFISDGISSLSKGDYSVATQVFTKAEELNSRFRFENTGRIEAFVASSQIPYIQRQCELGMLYIERKQTEKAKAIYESCLQLQFKYDLVNNGKIQQSLTALNNEIFSKGCAQSGVEFAKLLGHSEQLIGSGDYMKAVELLKVSDNLYEDNPFCGLDVDRSRDLLDVYAPAAKYQSLALEAQKALKNGNHEEFIEIYEKMELLSEEFEIVRSKIEPMPLHYLFSIKNNLALLENTVNFYQANDKYDTALELLRILENNNISAKNVRNMQIGLAEQMAMYDKSLNKASDPKQNVEKYTEGHSWFKHFKKAYIKKW